MTDHTPLPWRVEEGTDLIWGACTDDPSTYGMGYPIVEGKFSAWKSGKPNIDERMANAELIVRSVNALPDVVSALEAVRETLEAPDSRQERRLLDQIDAALAKARPAIMGDK